LYNPTNKQTNKLDENITFLTEVITTRELSQHQEALSLAHTAPTTKQHLLVTGRNQPNSHQYCDPVIRISPRGADHGGEGVLTP